MSGSPDNQDAPRFALVVDDEPLTLTVMSRMLAKEGYAVEVCASPTLALRALPNHKVHLVLSDYNLRQMTGLDLWHLIRSTPTTAEIAFILATTKVVHQQLRARHTDLPVILEKPFNSQLLRLALDAATGGPATALV